MASSLEPGGRACPVCGEVSAAEFKIWFDGYVKLYRCSTCRFVAQFAGPGCDTLITNYDEMFDLDFVGRGQRFKRPEKKSNYEDIIRRLSKYRPEGDLLDVGCGDGHFLSLCAERGYRVQGVEPSTALCPYAHEVSGALVRQGFYEKAMFEPESFHIITMIQVLEHIPEPRDILDTVWGHLRPGGILVVEVPSIAAPNFLAYRLTGISWFVRPPKGILRAHCNYFSPQSVAELMRRSRFEVKSLVTGRWGVKYTGALAGVGRILDPLFDTLGIGGILCIAQKR